MHVIFTVKDVTWLLKVLGYRVKSIKFLTVECSFNLIIGIKMPVAEFSTLRKQKNDFRVANRQAPHVLSFSVPKS